MEPHNNATLEGGRESFSLRPRAHAKSAFSLEQLHTGVGVVDQLPLVISHAAGDPSPFPSTCRRWGERLHSLSRIVLLATDANTHGM